MPVEHAKQLPVELRRRKDIPHVMDVRRPVGPLPSAGPLVVALPYQLIRIMPPQPVHVRIILSESLLIEIAQPGRRDGDTMGGIKAQHAA